MERHYKVRGLTPTTDEIVSNREMERHYILRELTPFIRKWIYFK